MMDGLPLPSFQALIAITSPGLSMRRGVLHGKTLKTCNPNWGSARAFQIPDQPFPDICQASPLPPTTVSLLPYAGGNDAAWC